MLIAGAEAAETAYAEALCCVYAHVRVIDSSASRGRLRGYDGSSYRVSADSFAELASTFLEDICAEETMGMEDCESNRECLDEVLAAVS